MIEIITKEQEIKAFIKNAISEAISQLPVMSNSTIEVVDAKVLMKRLGISAPTLIRWRDKGKIPYLSIGGSIRYNYPKVIDALEKGGIK